MLRKVIKHEISLSIKEISFICILMVVFSVLTPLSFKLNFGLLNFFVVCIFLLSILGALILSVLVLYRIFYKSMFENEGYLTNVLPIKASKLVIGKFLSGLFLTSIIYIFLIISVIIFTSINIGLSTSYQFVVQLLSQLLLIPTKIDFKVVGTFTNIILWFLFGILNSAAVFFFSATIFNTFKVRNYKFIILIVLYSVISQIIRTICQIPFVFLMSNMMLTLTTFNIVMIVSSVIYCITTVVLIFFTIYLVDKKVNIQ